jgi:hypothetical protein
LSTTVGSKDILYICTALGICDDQHEQHCLISHSSVIPPCYMYCLVGDHVKEYAVFSSLKSMCIHLWNAVKVCIVACISLKAICIVLFIAVHSINILIAIFSLHRMFKKITP